MYIGGIDQHFDINACGFDELSTLTCMHMPRMEERVHRFIVHWPAATWLESTVALGICGPSFAALAAATPVAVACAIAALHTADPATPLVNK